MKNSYLKKLVVLNFLLVASLKSEARERIDNSIINRSTAQEIFVTFGRSTVLILPCPIVSFSDGPTYDIQALVNERNSKMIEIWFSKNSPNKSGGNFG